MESKARARGKDREVQGELEGLAADAPRESGGAPAAGPDPAGANPGEEGSEPEAGVDPAAEEGAERLRAALDALERKVGLLLERHEELAGLHAEAIEDGRRSAERLARLERDGLDPVEVDARIRSLEEENERLARHAEFLEERIRAMMSRVRYVVEA